MINRRRSDKSDGMYRRDIYLLGPVVCRRRDMCFLRRGGEKVSCGPHVTQVGPPPIAPAPPPGAGSAALSFPFRQPSCKSANAL